MKKLLLSALSALFIVGASAQDFIDDFNYGSSAGNLTTLNPAYAAHSGTASFIQYSPTGLTVVGYTSPTNAGGSISWANGSGSREDINRAISPAVTTGSVYASFILRVTNSGGTTGDYSFHFIDAAGPTAGTTFKGKLFIKDGSTVGTFKLGITKATSTIASVVFTTSDYNLNQDYIIVLKYEFVAGTGNDNCSAFIFSSAIPAVEPVADIIASDVSAADFAQVGSFAIRQGGNTVPIAGQIDGLRISTTWTNNPLPVVISSFTATKNTEASILRWSTASEGNNSHFEIQRSIDNKKFEAIGTVKGSGNSSKKVNYSFTDGASLTAKTLYYRLKQIDFDGKAEYSKTVNVSNAAPAKGISNTLPNPFNDELNVTINVAANVNATVVIMDLIGKVQHTSTEQFQAGANKVSVNTTNMPDGIYFVRVSYNGETFTQKVIKK